MTDNIQHLRLVNGEEIIGDILFSDDYQVLVDSPLVIDEKVTDQGSAIVLSQYIPYALNSVCNIPKRHIIVMNELNPEIKRYYYNSLKFAIKATEKTIKEIDKINQLMEAAIEEDELLESLDQSRLVKGSSTIN